MDAEYLGRLLQKEVDSGKVAGLNVLVLKDQKEIVYCQAGYADVEAKRLYERDTIVRLYSMSKPITAAAVMLLMERGQLDLATPVADLLPGFERLCVWEKEQAVSPRRSLLVKDLLSMTSGLPYPGDASDPAARRVSAVFDKIDQNLYTDHQMSTLEIAKELGRCGLSFHPGERWMYGTSADILGAIVEVVSGRRFSEFLQDEFFGPLGMKDTAFYVPQKKQERLAKVYEWDGTKYVEFPTNNLGIMYEQKMKPEFESGGAGLVSTIDDYARFATMLMNQGNYEGKQIMSPATVRYFTTAKLTPWQQESVWKSWESMYGYGYGNLMRIMQEPEMAFFQTGRGEYGWDGWLGAYFCNLPEEKVTILLTLQKRDAGTTESTRKIRNVIASML